MSSYIAKYTLEQDTLLQEQFFLPWLFSWLFPNEFQAGKGLLEETNHHHQKINYPDEQCHQLKN